MNEKFVLMKCFICSSDNVEQIFKKLTHSVTSDSEMIQKEVSNVICINCGNVFSESGARNNVGIFYSDSYKLMSESPEAESKFYSQDVGVSHSDWRCNILLDTLKLPEIGNVLDIGCGKGNFLLAFSQKFPKWSLNGVEASKNALSFAKKKLLKADLREGFFRDGLFDKKFDLIVALDVFEHLEEPVEFLNTIIPNLKDDGYLFLDVPNFKLNPADLFVFDHLTHFTKESLYNLLSHNGMEVISIKENSDRMPLFMVSKKSSSRKQIKNNYLMMKNLVNDHIKFNESMLNTYCKANSEYDNIGVFGLGIMIWVGIQNNNIRKEKIISFFDENEFLIGQKKSGIEIRGLTDIEKFKNLPLVFSLSTCYIENVIRKISKFAVSYVAPEDYQYYKKYF
jgi:2-polyprenyl-3-methyl-5-hydroxy-6-metoxy-1,4-benzoquinol methylase